MPRTTVRTTSALALVGVLSLSALSACSGGGKADAAKGASSSNDLQPATSSSAASPAVGSALTAAQVNKALPKTSDLPKGWKVDTTSTLTSSMTTKDSDSVTPASCSAAGQVQQNFNFVAPASAHGAIDFVGPKQTTFVGTTIYSYADPYPATELGAIRAAVQKCPSYQETEDDGSLVPDAVSLVSVPAMGDESLGLEVKSTYQGLSLDLVIVLVRTGNTLVAVEDAAVGAPASPDQAVTVARTTLTRLPKA